MRGCGVAPVLAMVVMSMAASALDARAQAAGGPPPLLDAATDTPPSDTPPSDTSDTTPSDTPSTAAPTSDAPTADTPTTPPTNAAAADPAATDVQPPNPPARPSSAKPPPPSKEADALPPPDGPGMMQPLAIGAGAAAGTLVGCATGAACLFTPVSIAACVPLVACPGAGAVAGAALTGERDPTALVAVGAGAGVGSLVGALAAGIPTLLLTLQPAAFLPEVDLIAVIPATAAGALVGGVGGALLTNALVPRGLFTDAPAP